VLTTDETSAEETGNNENSSPGRPLEMVLPFSDKKAPQSSQESLGETPNLEAAATSHQLEDDAASMREMSLEDLNAKLDDLASTTEALKSKMDTANEAYQKEQEDAEMHRKAEEERLLQESLEIDRAVHSPPYDSEAAATLRHGDAHGEVSFDQLSFNALSPRGASQSIPQVHGVIAATSAADAVFDAIDANHDGVISREEMRQVLSPHSVVNNRPQCYQSSVD
jgi:hypothetical protein